VSSRTARVFASGPLHGDRLAALFGTVGRTG